MPYPTPQPVQSQHSGSSSSSDENQNIDSKSNGADNQKADTKPQATFLTKLYALLEREENHHMIRWDPAGEHIIVERPEQLALHVLPSIYRQSRFASFSRQLNIYGFMRKVNLRNVDPAIDDPDASTWSHPTLNRHSAPEVVANFKRRVPPRLPKPRKGRDTQEQPTIPPPRSAIGMGAVPLTVPSVGGPIHKMPGGHVGTRNRGYSAPGSFNPLGHGPSSWSTSNYPRSALPPLTVPSDPPHLSHGGMYNNSSHALHPIGSGDETSTSSGFSSMSSYSNSSRNLMSSQYSYNDQNSWSFSGDNASSNHAPNSSLSSLLNPSSGGYSRPTINTSYASPFSSMPMQSEHTGSSLSPDSRPATGYSMSSSLPYQDEPMHSEYSRPGSSHRPGSPSRPHSSKSNYPNGTLSVRRGRRHSQAMSPYPSPYDHPPEQRPSTSPRPVGDDHSSSNGNGLPRARSMIQLPSVDPYGFTPNQADFAYSSIPGSVAQSNSMDMDNNWNHRNTRPSTSTSSISAASHTSSSQANTPPLTDNYTDINRFSPDFGFVQMSEHLQPQLQYNKTPGEL
ncbi:HSF-type DNA-binding-domain-containing protein [Coprinopsis sp. MPI-PUGE-AT-0042]|nr:HSF-type DNA-binding-domain-containing protein [Coprinopsis sp. MPI-PUGE-AT-0042]